MHARLVPLMVWKQTARTIQDCIIKPQGSHRSLERRHNKVEKCGITPPHCCCTARSGERDKGMGPYSSNGPVSHPGGELHQRNLDSDIAGIHHSPFPERTERYSTTSRLRLNLRGEQSLLTPLLFPRNPSSTHNSHTRSWHTNRIISAPNPYLIRRSRECPVEGDDDTSPPGDGTGSPIKGKSGRDAVPEGTHPYNNTRDTEIDKEFFNLTGKYLGKEFSLWLSVARWPRHIDRFELKYDKAFAKKPLFGADLSDRIHKRLQVFLQSCNTTSIEDVELGALAELEGSTRR